MIKWYNLKFANKKYQPDLSSLLKCIIQYSSTILSSTDLKLHLWRLGRFVIRICFDERRYWANIFYGDLFSYICLRITLLMFSRLWKVFEYLSVKIEYCLDVEKINSIETIISNIFGATGNCEFYTMTEIPIRPNHASCKNFCFK